MMSLTLGRAWLLLSVLTILGGAGCKSDPYCLNCADGAIDSGRDTAQPVDLAGADLVEPVDLTGSACSATNAGVELCDGIDNDCNGIVDDVAASKLAGDPNNCGACGNACNYTAQKQFGACDATSGTPTCKPAGCLPGYVDADGNAGNGCEYACTPSNGGVEICDSKDNDCNGIVDDGFDLQNDPSHCGGCGTSCARPNTPGTCLLGACKITGCNTGYKDIDGNPTNGCEYLCSVEPPTAEVCDGKDNDCNGKKDDSPTDVGGACNQFCGSVAACVASNSCSYALSACTGGCCGVCTQGMTACSGGASVCQAGMRPMLEVCNNVDDNCDGQIDEGFDKQNDAQNCGTCGNVCNLANVLTYKCAVGSCGIAHTGTAGTPAYKQSGCKPGFSDLDSNPMNGCEHTCEVYPSTVETCDGKDNNCDGNVDEPSGMTAPSNFCRQTSICSGAQPVCCGASGWLCDYKSVNANIEIQQASPLSCKAVPSGTTRLAGTLVFAEAKCDNFDGDCKGGADDSFTQKGQACTVGIGVCAGTGNFVCNGAGTGVQCPAAANPGAAAAEECDGKDNNCDGQVDERVAGAGFLAGYIDRFVQVSASLWVYEYEAARVDATAANAGTASAGRACSRPSVLPWASVTQAQAAAACGAIVLANGTTARLCNEAEWQTACEGKTGPATNSYSYSAAKTAYTSNVCNDVNHASNAPWVTGFDTGNAKKCYSDWSGAFTQSIDRLYDLSGNLMEWTSSTVVVTGNPTTYYRVRGGSYNSPSDGTPPDGTSCEFDFNILPTGFSNTNVGFRCCADSAP